MNKKIFFNQIFSILAIIIVLSVAGFAQSRDWKTFSPADGNWSITAPGMLRPDEEAREPKGKQGTYAYNDSNGFFAIIYKDAPKFKLFFSKEKFFTKQRDLVIKSNTGSKLLRDDAFKTGDISGREVQILIPDTRVIARESGVKPRNNVQRFRMFFDGNRFYTILAVLPEENINSSEITNFLTSFALKKPS